MSDRRKVQEVTSADDKSIGFEYQHLYALYLLLNMNTDETLGIEIKDDIHKINEHGSALPK